MNIGTDVIKQEDGRWIWTVMSVNDDAGSGAVGQSILSFSTNEEARLDLDAHFAAPLTGNGRRIRSKEDIQALIRVAASMCKDCTDSYFGGVYWHEPDNTGCNWSVSCISGADWRGCMDCIHAAAVDLREQYNIKDEG